MKPTPMTEDQRAILQAATALFPDSCEYVAQSAEFEKLLSTEQLLNLAIERSARIAAALAAEIRRRA